MMIRILVSLAAAAWFGIAAAQSFPTRPITLITPFPPGGSTDTTARVIADAMRAPLGQAVVVETVAGAGGTIGVARTARSAPDGYTIEIGQWDNHVGGIIFALALGSLWALRGDRRRWGFLAIALIAWVHAMGLDTPIYRVMYALIPPIRNFRAPSLSMFLVFASFSVLAAMGLQKAFAGAGDPRARTILGRALGIGAVSCEGADAARGAARRRLELDHVRAEPGEQPPAVLGVLVGELEHPDVREIAAARHPASRRMRRGLRSLRGWRGDVRTHPANAAASANGVVR